MKRWLSVFTIILWCLSVASYGQTFFQSFDGMTLSGLLASGWYDISTSPRRELQVRNIDGRDVLFLRAWGGNVTDMDVGIEYRGLNSGLSTIWSVEYVARDISPVPGAAGNSWAIGVGQQDYYRVAGTSITQIGLFGCDCNFNSFQIHYNRIGHYASYYDSGYPLGADFHLFRIESDGTDIWYYIDGAPVYTELNGAFPATRIFIGVPGGNGDSRVDVDSVRFTVGGGQNGVNQNIRNGDFSNGMQDWTEWPYPGCAGQRTVSILPFDDAHSNVFQATSTGAGGCGGHSAIIQPLNINVSEYSSLVFSADVKASYASLSNCGYGGGEHPIEIVLQYLNTAGQTRYLQFGFYYSGSSNCANPPSDPEWTKVPQLVPQGQWFSFTSTNIKNLIPTASVIKQIWVRGNGWDYVGLADNLNLELTPTDTTPPTIEITSPSNGSTYALNQAVAAAYTCTDSGSGIANCVGAVSNGSNIDTSTAGNKSFSVAATDKAGNSATSSVTYTVLQPAMVTLSPASLGFGNQGVSTVSSVRTVSLANTGGTTLHISGITLTGDFTQTNNCGAAVGAGLSCTFSVTFSPTATGSRTGSIAITDDAAGSPHLVTLSGTGILNPTSTALTTSRNPSYRCQPAVFTAAVSSDVDLPTGTVTFMEGGLTLGTSTLNGFGQATFSISTLSAGLHSITAVYSGDNKYAGSTSSVVVQTVNEAIPNVASINASVDPVMLNTMVNASASFTDPGGSDNHNAVWDWGDGSTSAGSISETGGAGTVTGTHAYTVPGVYRLFLTVTNGCGNSGRSPEFQYIVVYDPAGGFVTGGGWIVSPAGAYAANLALSGKATFGFVSKYLQGANTPSGNTQFKFHAADFSFQSTNYQWLVVAGAKAQFKGDGVINDNGSYGFLLTAIDGQLNGGGGVDRFRIKIWDKASEQIVYDNQAGADDDSDATTALGAGSVVIHK